MTSPTFSAGTTSAINIVPARLGATDNDLVEGDKTFTLSATLSGYTITPLTLTITDNERAAITFGDDVTVDEDVGSVTVTATLDVAVEGSGFTVDASTGGGTATAGSDYTEVTAQTLSFAGMAGDMAEITVAITDDGDGEGNETFTVSLDSGSLSRSLPITITDTVTVTITDNDAPIVTLGDVTVAEDVAAGVVELMATLSGVVTGGFSVPVSTADGTGPGAATAPADYTAVSAQTLNFTGTMAGETQTFTVPIVNDMVAEAVDETFSVSLGIPTTGGTAIGTDILGVGAGATVTITDDDMAPTDITLTLSMDRVPESGTIPITVTAAFPVDSDTLPDATAVTVSVASGTATAGTDFTAVGDFMVTIPAEMTSGTAMFNLVVTGDTLAEGDETLTISGSATGITTLDDVTLTITDDDLAMITLGDESVDEDGVSVTVTATLNVAIQGEPDFTVDASIEDDTTTSGSDYTAVGTQTLSFDGTAGDTATFTVMITDDSDAEGSETFTVSLDNLSGTSVPVTITDTATVTIIDNDAPTVTIADVTVDEGDSGTSTVITLTATLDAVTAEGFSVPVLPQDGTALSRSDYMQISGQTLNFLGTADEEQTFTVTILGDTLVEGDETFSIFLGSVTGGGQPVSTGDSATVTITDDDTAPTQINLTLSMDSVAESGTTPITVTAAFPMGSDTLPDATEVTVSVAAGATNPATAGTDFTAVDDITVMIPAGATSGQGTFNLAVTGDTVAEGDETLAVSGASGTFTIAAVPLTITDDDLATITLGNESVAEDVSSGTVTVTATLNVAIQGSPAFTVVASTTDGTATAGSDYTAVSAQTLNFDGTAGDTATFTVALTNDSEAEGSEDFTVSLGNLSGTTVPVDVTDRATVTIIDDDTPRVTLGDESVAENVTGSSVTVTATLNNAVTGGFTVNVSTANVTAGAGDYTALSAHTLTFTGTASETQEFTVAITDDSDAEPDETFTLSLSGLEGTTVTPFDISDTATVTITDDEPPTVALGDETVGEGDGTVTITAMLSRAVGESFTVAASTADGTGPGAATAGSDYTAVTTTMLSFAGTEGETQEFTVAITDDSDAEGDETFTVSLGSPSATTTAVTASDTATVTITDDDATVPLTLSLNPASVSERSGTATVSVTASVPADSAPATATEVTVTVAGGGTNPATAGEDFTPVPAFTITLAANAASGTGSFVLTVAGDDGQEDAETLIVSGTAGGGFVVAPATLTITDRVVPLTLSLNPTSVSERSGATTVSVTASVPADSAPATAVEVAVTVAGGTAVAGEDFTPVPAFTITLAANAASGTGAFMLTVVGDDGQEDAETLIVSGTAGGFSDGSATLTIVDATDRVVEVVGVELVRETIAEVSSAVAARVSQQVSRRVVAPVVVGNLDLQTSLARGLSANQQALNEGEGSWRELLGGSSFEFRVGEDPDGLPLSDSESSRSSGIGVWAAVEGRRLSHSGGELGDYDGRLFFVHAGADLRIGQGLAGLAVSSSRGEFDFDDNTQQDADTELLNYTLYLGGPLGDVANLWATLGYGAGELVSGPDGNRDTSDIRMTAASFGGRANVASGGGLALDFEGEVSSGNLKVDDSGGGAGPASDVHSLRLALDLGKDTEEDSGILLSRSVKFGVRLEGGDGETGTGAGIGARLSRADPDTGLTLELTGDVLFSREGDGKTREGGLGGSVRYQQQEHGRGLSLHTRSSYSTASEDPVRLWLENGTTGSDASAEAVFDVEAGYGLPMLRGDILLTPYYGFEFTRENARQHLLGSRVRIHPMIELEMESAWRDTVSERDSEGRLDLRLRMRW